MYLHIFLHLKTKPSICSPIQKNKTLLLHIYIYFSLIFFSTCASNNQDEWGGGGSVSAFNIHLSHGDTMHCRQRQECDDVTDDLALATPLDSTALFCSGQHKTKNSSFETSSFQLYNSHLLGVYTYKKKKNASVQKKNIFMKIFFWCCWNILHPSLSSASTKQTSLRGFIIASTGFTIPRSLAVFTPFFLA